MSKMEYASFLRNHIEEIVPLTDEEFECILACYVPRRVAKKDALIRAGSRVNSEFLVVRGCLKTSAYDAKGKEHIIQFATENWWVSDYVAYAKRGIAEMTVQALEESFVLELSIDHRVELCDRIPKLNIFRLQKAFGGYVGSQQRVLSLLRNGAKEKYELLLKQYPQLFQRLPKKVIAQYLGVSRETLSRLQR